MPQTAENSVQPLGNGFLGQNSLKDAGSKDFHLTEIRVVSEFGN
ncbi:hypothetical protein NNRS527_03196 (plasmid) [Nitrosospira sp. NRS527]|nr:hypothetical protein NNRS527_03196 [Nitrosospira sp. NRS527]